MKSALESIVDAIRSRQRFVISSHARPDGDSIGSELALAYALELLGKDVQVVNHDRVPPYLREFPGVDDIVVSGRVDGTFDAAIVLECASLDRTEVSGLDAHYLINIDHHVGNEMYGDVNWFDAGAAACGEMVFDVITALKVDLTPAIATHLYVAILTDTGSFHHSNITERTFEICRLATAAGVRPADVASQVYQQASIGKLKITGALLDTMHLTEDGQIAVLALDDRALARAQCAQDDLEGLVNMPLTAQTVRATVMFKMLDGHLRVSLRSKDDVDVREVAVAYGGGGHRNAAGFTVATPTQTTRQEVVDRVARALAVNTASRRG